MKIQAIEPETFEGVQRVVCEMMNRTTSLEPFGLRNYAQRLQARLDRAELIELPDEVLTRAELLEIVREQNEAMFVRMQNLRDEITLQDVLAWADGGPLGSSQEEFLAGMIRRNSFGWARK